MITDDTKKQNRPKNNEFISFCLFCVNLQFVLVRSFQSYIRQYKTSFKILLKKIYSVFAHPTEFMNDLHCKTAVGDTPAVVWPVWIIYRKQTEQNKRAKRSTCEDSTAFLPRL